MLSGVEAWFDGVEYLLPVSTLEPFEGYFVFNAESTPVTLKVPPTESFEESDLSLSKSQAWQTGDYVLRLMATVPGTTLRDSQNYLGFRAGATDVLDALDLFAPPPIGDHVQLNIVEAGYGLAMNFKTGNDFGQEWFLEITTSLARKPIAISFEESGDRPAGFELFVFDQDLRSIVPVQNASFTLRPEGNLKVRHLRILIGTTSVSRNAPTKDN